MDPLFEPDGDLLVPTAVTRGPWDPRAQHGGPPAALCARAVERHPGGEGMRLTRLTVELLRPVPLRPLRIRTELIRPGRRVQLVETVVEADGVAVIRAVGLRQAVAAAAPVEVIGQGPPAPGPDHGTPADPWDRHGVHPMFHLDGVEIRLVEGSFGTPGPAFAWIRLRHPLVADEPTTAACRVAAAADFGNGISSVLERGDTRSYINPDLTVSIHRHPQGEWVGLDAATVFRSDGVGMAESVLHDLEGPIGRAVQLLVTG